MLSLPYADDQEGPRPCGADGGSINPAICASHNERAVLLSVASDSSAHESPCLPRTQELFCPHCRDRPCETRPSPHFRETVRLVETLYKVIQMAADKQTVLFFSERSEYTLLLKQLLDATIYLERADTSDEERKHAQNCLACLATLTCLHSEGAQTLQPGRQAQPPNVHARDAPAWQAATTPAYCVMLDVEIRRLVSFPKPGPAKFESLYEALLPRDCVARFVKPVPPTHEMLYTLWSCWRTCSEQSVRATMDRRIDACGQLLNKIRLLSSDAAAQLAAASASHVQHPVNPFLPNVAPKLPCQPPLLGLQSPELRKLLFVNQFEAYTQYGQLKSLRGAALDARLSARRGKTRLLQLIRVVDHAKEGFSVEATFRVLSDQFESVCLSKRFGRVIAQEWILESNDAAGWHDAMRFHDLPLCQKLSPQAYDKSVSGANVFMLKGMHLNFASVLNVIERRQADGSTTEELTLLLKHPESRENPPINAATGAMYSTSALVLAPQSTYVLSPRFMDYTSSKVVDRLTEDSLREYTKEARKPLFLELIKQPEVWGLRAEPLWGGPPTRRSPRPLLDMIEKLGPMTASQEASYEKLYNHVRLLLLWGPPGAGKTHFLASVICRLVLRALYEGRQMRVLVTAVSHPAINNLLLKIQKLMQRLPPMFQTIAYKFAKVRARPDYTQIEPHSLILATTLP